MEIETRIKPSDRRVKRSLRLLKQAFLELLQERGFAAISIQDITDRAEVNRGTFYAHFPDKYALLDVIVREQFQRYLASKLPPTASWDRNNLRLLIQAALLYSKETSYCTPKETIVLLVRKAIQEELAELILRWLKQIPVPKNAWRVPIEVMASMISWSIFGAGADWCLNEKTPSLEQMTNHILTMITEGAARLTPNGLPE